MQPSLKSIQESAVRLAPITSLRSQGPDLRNLCRFSNFKLHAFALFQIY